MSLLDRVDLVTAERCMKCRGTKPSPGPDVRLPLCVRHDRDLRAGLAVEEASKGLPSPACPHLRLDGTFMLHPTPEAVHPCVKGAEPHEEHADADGETWTMSDYEDEDDGA